MAVSCIVAYSDVRGMAFLRLQQRAFPAIRLSPFIIARIWCLAALFIRIPVAQ